MSEPDYQIIRTAAELTKVGEAIASGAFRSSVFMVGPGGTGKSTVMAKALPPIDPKDSPRDPKQGAHWVRGTVSPSAFYIELFRHLDRTIVADDCHDLYGNPQFRPLLKQINATEPTKVVTWHKLNREMQAQGVPPSFETTSRFVLIGNDWRTMGKDVEAIEDRVHLFKYEPPPNELLLYAAPWFPDQEVLKYAEDAVKAGRLRRLSLRMLIKTVEIKQTGLMAWEAYLDRRLLAGDGHGFSDDTRAVLEWVERHGKATFTSGEVGRSLTRFKGDRQRRDAALDWLQEQGHIHRLPSPRSGPKGGRPQEAVFGLGSGPHNSETRNLQASTDGVLGL
jgi:hypothetical protein